MTDARADRYNAGAMTLHWLIAILLLTNICLAWYFNTLHGLAKVPPVQLHKSIGITILLLSLLRLAWRFISPPPSLPASVTGWERFAANAVYGLFYVVMLGMPLSGWALTSASKQIQIYPIVLYGVVHWPAIGPLTTLAPAKMKAVHHLFVTTHVLLSYMAYGLLVLHVGAALRHQFIKRDVVMGRMLPFIRRPA